MISAEKKQSQHKFVGLFLGVDSGRKLLCIVDTIGLGLVGNCSSLFSTELL